MIENMKENVQKCTIINLDPRHTDHSFDIRFEHQVGKAVKLLTDFI
jgi:hypothetical protein